MRSNSHPNEPVGARGQRWRRLGWISLFAWLLCSGVFCRLPTLDLRHFPCRSDDQCQGSLRCTDGFCGGKKTLQEPPPASDRGEGAAEPALDTSEPQIPDASDEITPEDAGEPPMEPMPDERPPERRPELPPELPPEPSKSMQINWVRFPGGVPGVRIETITVAAGPKGSAYVAGSFEVFHDAKRASFGGAADAFVGQYDAAGKLLWLEVIGADVGGEVILDLHVAADGSLLVVGFFYGTIAVGLANATSQKQPDGSTYNSDIFVVKVTPRPAGKPELKLVATLGSPYYDAPNAVTSDAQGQIYVGSYISKGPKLFNGKTKLTDFTKGEVDIAITQLAADGSHRWTRMWGSGRWDSPSRRGLIVDDAKDGFLYVSGVFSGLLFDESGAVIATNKGNRDGVVLKLRKSDGKTIWVLPILGEGFNGSTAIAREPVTGDLFVAGEFEQTIDVTLADGTTKSLKSQGSGDIFLLRITSGGKVQWARRYGGAAQEVMRAMALGANGMIYLTGSIARGLAQFGTFPKAVVGARNSYLLQVRANDGEPLGLLSIPGGDNTGLSLSASSDGWLWMGGHFSNTAFFGASQHFPAQSSWDNYLLKIKALP